MTGTANELGSCACNHGRAILGEQQTEGENPEDHGTSPEHGRVDQRVRKSWRENRTW